MASFVHQPFEEWLLSDEGLSAEQSQTLRVHLESCEQCSMLSAGWREAALELKVAPVVSPAAGFSQRWQVRLEERRLAQQKRQSMLFLAISLGAAILLIFALGILALPFFQSPYPALLALAYQVTSFYSVTNTVTVVAARLIQTIAGVIPPTMWVSMIAALGALVVVWVMAIRKLAFPRRVTA